jgi:hypothetical protein
LDEKGQSAKRPIAHGTKSPIERGPIPLHSMNQMDGKRAIADIQSGFSDEPLQYVVR